MQAFDASVVQSSTLNLQPTDGAQLMLGFALMPNRLGYCGGPDQRELRDYYVDGRSDPGLTRLLHRFEGAMPYLRPKERLPAIGGMARTCAPGGEVRVLFQSPRPRALQLAVHGLGFLPEAVFARAVAPAITTALQPFARRLLGGAVPRHELHYRVSLGLYGLHFGFPPSLARYRFEVERCRFIAPELSAAFAIPAADARGW